MVPDKERPRHDVRSDAFADRLIEDPEFGADAESEFAALVTLAAAALAVAGPDGTPGVRPGGAVPP